MDEEVFYDADDEYRDPGTGASYSVHRAAFDNDVAKLTALLKQTPVEELGVLDVHGNNPLHIAALRGSTDAVQVLLDAGLPPAGRSSRGWTPLDEALAARAMPAARLLQRRLLADAKAEMKLKRAQLLETMRSMPDYSLQLKWQIGSSLPGLGMLLRRYAPHDTYTIWKVGDRLRVDGSLMGIDTKNIMPEWKRGHFSLVVDGSPAGVAAAAEATAAAVAAATAAAEARQQRAHQKGKQRGQQEEQSPVCDAPSAAAAAAAEDKSEAGSRPGLAAGLADSTEFGKPESSCAVASSRPEASASAAAPVAPAAAPALAAAPPPALAAERNAAVEGSPAAAGSSAAAAAHEDGSESEQFYDTDEQSQQPAAARSNGASSSSNASSSSSSMMNGCGGGSSSSSNSSSGGGGGAAAAAAGSSRGAAAGGSAENADAVAARSAGSPRLLFLNHVKDSWVDLSADKKALKLEGRAEEEELEDELFAAMDRDVGKTRLKPRNFKFAPVRAWLGGNMTEKVEGWRCTVYEATGKLLAVSTSKARLPLPQGGTFEDYLAAEYEADSVTETLIDPLNPNGLSPGGARDSSGPSSSSSSRYKQRGREGYQGEKAALTYGSGGEPDSMGLGSDADYDALMWNEPSSDGKKAATSSSSSRLFGKKGSSQPSGAGSTGDAAGSSSSSGGRLLRARCWMAQEFPMKLAQLLPLLDVIGTANKHMAKVGKFLAKYTELDMFPVKLQVPLLLTVYVLVSFKAFHPLQHGTAHPPPPEEFFDVPGTYKRRLLSEVMDKAAASMMGLGSGSRGGSEGGSMFYDGDDTEDSMGFGGGEELFEEQDLYRLEASHAASSSPSSTSRVGSGSRNSSKRLGRRDREEVRIGSGLDDLEYMDGRKW